MILLLDMMAIAREREPKWEFRGLCDVAPAKMAG